VRTDDFDYDLPRELIAQHPIPRRDQSRLLVLDRAADSIEHRRFRDIVDTLHAGDLLVLNDTKVVPARLVGHRSTGGRVEALLVEPAASGWAALLKCRGRLREGEGIEFEGGAIRAVYRGRDESGKALLDFGLATAELMGKLENAGRAPLPPYIKRPPEDDPDRADDRERYQTVYAAAPGAIAAPTAGLHFTSDLLGRLAARGVRHTTVTLHVGLGTFQPVTAEHVADHDMHAEAFEFPAEAARAIEQTTGRVVAVGTTATRVIETVASQPEWGAASGWTDIFITPGYAFKRVDALLTNFHLPRSTLLMLVSALAGRERILAAYEEAIRLRYRFYSYGDAMLIL
jgi:S-adenosylmethionine:tRNA ribosyltransferase-isomerase